MTEEQKAAYVFAQSVAALAEIIGMLAATQVRTYKGLAPVYNENAFRDVVDKYGLDHNTLISFFQSM